MTPITKQQVEELIDRLADKSLTFGCLVEDLGRSSGDYVVAGRNPYKKGLVDCLEKKVLSVYSFSTERLKVLGHPILIGDVLEKMSKQDKVFELREVCKFLEAWEMCVTEEERAQGKTGFTKSLQEIAEGAWEEMWGCECGEMLPKGIPFDPEVHDKHHYTEKEALKDENVEALVSFLISLDLLREGKFNNTAK